MRDRRALPIASPARRLRFWRLGTLALGWLALTNASLRAEDWTTTDGKVYQGVTVVKTEPDAVTIIFKDGGALVPLAKLPADLQKRFNYDPAKAQAAANARAKAESDNAQVLLAEKKQAAKLNADKEAQTKAAEKEAKAHVNDALNPPSLPGASLNGSNGSKDDKPFEDRK